MNTPEFETLSLTVEDAIATITLNRPQQMNAFNLTMMQELIRAFDLTDADDDVRAVGLSTALEWCFTGRLINADEARERGLVRSVHAPDELYPAAVAIAREIADNTAQVSVAMTRQMLWRMVGAEHPMAAHELDSRAIQARGASEDACEGVASFLEKRPAEYPNRVSTDMPEFFDWQGEPPFK
jgi:enoyl-CoA hydratase/carnithine racemase